MSTGPEKQPAVKSGSSKPGRWHFILGPWGRDRISHGEHLHSAQYREVVNCLYGPTSPGRARRHLCVKTLYPGGGKKNTKKIKRGKIQNKMKASHISDGFPQYAAKSGCLRTLNLSTAVLDFLTSPNLPHSKPSFNSLVPHRSSGYQGG